MAGYFLIMRWVASLPLPPSHHITPTFHELEHGGILLDHEVRGVPPIVQQHVGLPVVGLDGAVDAPPEVVFALPAPGKDAEAWVGKKIIRNFDFPNNKKFCY